MKAKELIEQIKKQELEDFEIHFMTNYIDKNTFGYLSYDNLQINDIGYSDKIILLGDKDLYILEKEE